MLLVTLGLKLESGPNMGRDILVAPSPHRSQESRRITLVAEVLKYHVLVAKQKYGHGAWASTYIFFIYTHMHRYQHNCTHKNKHLFVHT